MRAPPQVGDFVTRWVSASFGLLLLAAAAAKAVDPSILSRQLSDWGLADSHLRLTSIGVAAAEAALGSALILAPRSRPLVHLAWAVACGFALFHFLRPNDACGCFADWLSPRSTRQVAVGAAVALTSAILLPTTRHPTRRSTLGWCVLLAPPVVVAMHALAGTWVTREAACAAARRIATVSQTDTGTIVVGSLDCAHCRHAVEQVELLRPRRPGRAKVLVTPFSESDRDYGELRAHGWHIRTVDDDDWRALVRGTPPLVFHFGPLATGR